MEDKNQASQDAAKAPTIESSSTDQAQTQAQPSNLPEQTEGLLVANEAQTDLPGEKPDRKSRAMEPGDALNDIQAPETKKKNKKRSPHKGKKKDRKLKKDSQELLGSTAPSSPRDLEVMLEATKKGEDKEKEKEEGPDHDPDQHKGKATEKRSEPKVPRIDTSLATTPLPEGRRKSKGQMKRLSSALRNSMLSSFNSPRSPTTTTTTTTTTSEISSNPLPPVPSPPIDLGVLHIGPVDPKSWCTQRNIELALNRAFPPSFAHLFFKKVRARADEVLASQSKLSAKARRKFLRRTLKDAYLTHVLQTLWTLSSGQGYESNDLAQFSLMLRKPLIRHIECIWLLTLWGVDEKCIAQHRTQRLERIKWLGRRRAREIQSSAIWKQDAIILPSEIIHAIQALKSEKHPNALLLQGGRLLDLKNGQAHGLCRMVRLYAHEWAISMCNLWRKPAETLDAECIGDPLHVCCNADAKVAKRVITAITATRNLFYLPAFNGRVREIMMGMARVALSEIVDLLENDTRRKEDYATKREMLMRTYPQFVLRFFIVDCLGPELLEAAQDEGMSIKTVKSLWNLTLSALDLLPASERESYNADWSEFEATDDWKRLASEWRGLGRQFIEEIKIPYEFGDFDWKTHNY